MRLIDNETGKYKYSKKQHAELLKRAKPLHDYLGAMFNPYTKIVVGFGSVEVLSGEMYVGIDIVDPDPVVEQLRAELKKE